MRILVTGGFGYIGSRLGQHLSAQGCQVILTSRSEHSAPPQWLPTAEVKLISWDDPGLLVKLCEKVDVVIHAAGMNAQDCAENPQSANKFNCDASARLFEAAKIAKVQRFIFLSTAHIYGSPLVGCINESTVPSNVHPYATSNLAGESVVLNGSAKGGMQGVVIRLSNVVGAPALKEANCWMLLVNDLCRQAVQYQVMRLRSNGFQGRDFIAMKEVCNVLSFFARSSNESFGGQVFNLGSGKTSSILEVARLIQSRCEILLGFRPELSFDNVNIDSKPETIFNYEIEKLRSVVGDIDSDILGEIDGLLNFCVKLFKKQGGGN